MKNERLSLAPYNELCNEGPVPAGKVLRGSKRIDCATFRQEGVRETWIGARPRWTEPAA